MRMKLAVQVAEFFIKETGNSENKKISGISIANELEYRFGGDYTKQMLKDGSMCRAVCALLECEGYDIN